MRLRELQIKNLASTTSLWSPFEGPSRNCRREQHRQNRDHRCITAHVDSERDLDALRITEDDFRSGTNNAPIEISCTFSDASEKDEAHCQECLVDIGDGKFDIRINARIEFNRETRRASVK